MGAVNHGQRFGSLTVGHEAAYHAGSPAPSHKTPLLYHQECVGTSLRTPGTAMEIAFAYLLMNQVKATEHECQAGADIGFVLGRCRRLRGGIFSRLLGRHVPEWRQHINEGVEYALHGTPTAVPI